MKCRKRGKKVLLVVLIIVAALVVACLAYLGKYYHAQVDVKDYQTSVKESADGLYVFGTEAQKEDLVIFYPGAKVEYTAYLPLCHELAQNGVDCYIVKMPGNLAFFGMDKAADIMGTYNQYDQYYLAGHSLGGAMGASYVADNMDAFDGMIFLAAYPTKSLAADDFRVLSIYGSEDLVVNMEKIVEGRGYMPADYTEICIEGGNHAQFGNYGVQEGDGVASISTAEQQKQTVDAIVEMVK